MQHINGKRIWVTGASSGIGEALTYNLNQLGCFLVISSRRMEALEMVKKNCSYPEKVAVLPLDLEDFETLPQAAKKATAFYDGIDILINNGGISQRSLIANTKFEVFKKMIEVNYIKAIERNKYEVYIGGKETFGVYLKRFFPRILHKVVLKSSVR